MMSEKIKNYLGISGAIALVAFTLTSLLVADSYLESVDLSSARSFSVSGEGRVTVIPDTAEFSLTVITEGGKDLGALQENNAGKMNNITAFLKEQGVEEKDIKTTSYNIQPRYQYFSCGPTPLGSTREPCPPPEIVGYSIRQTVRVEAHDFSKVGNILSGAVERGANSVSSLSFTVSDEDKFRNEARELAIKNAQEKAESIADAGDFNVGRLLSLDESVNYPYPVYRTAVAEDGGFGGAAGVAPSVEQGSQEITINVSLRYEID